MKYSLTNIQYTIELSTDYRFELIKVLNHPVLKLKYLPEGFELYIELNKGTKTINPYISIVSVNNYTGAVNRNNELYDINKALIHIKNKLFYFNIDYKKSRKPVEYLQEKLIF